MSPQVTAAVIAGALTLIGTLAVQYFGRRATKRDLEEQRKQLDRTLTEQRTRSLNERFATAAGQLGDDKPPTVRLAGVHAMAGLADDWPENRQTCVDVLCGYLRMPYEPDPGDEAPEPEQLAFRASREVRHTVIRVITAHLKEDAAVSWQGLNFDFTGVVFDSGDFGGARFSGGTVSFRNAQFSADMVDFGAAVDFGGARFSGGTVDFGGAQFSGGTVDFGNAQFSGGTVSFINAQLARNSTVDFSNARFSGGTVDFSSAVFSGGLVSFVNAQFSGGTVDFGNAQFSGGTANFGNAEFSGGRVDFGSVEFSDSPVDFRNARFSGGTVDFGYAQFTGDAVYFGDALFSGGTVYFGGARFSRATVYFRSARFSGATVDFRGARFYGGTDDFGAPLPAGTDDFSGGTVDFSDAADWSYPPTFPWTDTPPPGVKLPRKEDPSQA